MSQEQPQLQLMNHHHVNGVQPQPDHAAEAESTAAPSTSAVALPNGVVSGSTAAAGPVAEVEPRVPGSSATVEEPLPAGSVTNFRMMHVIFFLLVKLSSKSLMVFLL